MIEPVTCECECARTVVCRVVECIDFRGPTQPIQEYASIAGSLAHKDVLLLPPSRSVSFSRGIILILTTRVLILTYKVSLSLSQVTVSVESHSHSRVTVT